MALGRLATSFDRAPTRQHRQEKILQRKPERAMGIPDISMYSTQGEKDSNTTMRAFGYQIQLKIVNHSKVEHLSLLRLLHLPNYLVLPLQPISDILPVH